MSTARKQATRLPRPAARYWKGKAPKGAAEIESDSDLEEESQTLEEGDVLIEGNQDIIQEEDEEEDGMQIRKALPKARAMNVALKDVSVSKEGKVTVAGRVESGRTALEDKEESELEESEDEQKEGSKAQGGTEESSEYESESEEEEKPKLQFRPVFVPKRARTTVADREAIARDSEEALRKKEEEAEERRKQSHDLVAESIRRELAEKEKEDIIPDVDDTDGLDPAAEFEAWRLRELGRIKKEKEEDLRREEEREEIERRRDMPEEQRLKEDLERARKLREEKPKGQQKFLQKYWHKGAFHQDEEILRKHDFTEATESTVDVSLLPKVMQVRNFGKRSRTKYTHLLDQDTTASSGGFGGTAPVKAGGMSTDGGGCFLCGGPHLKKDCPQNTGPLTNRVTGANAAPTGIRTSGSSQDRGSWRDRNSESRRGPEEYRQRDQHRPRSNDVDGRGEDGYHAKRARRPDYPHHSVSRRSRSRSRSRSHSPLRKNYKDMNYDRKERRRSRERSLDDGYREKRRRVD